ncbi:MAG: DUF255 domain-containing protein [Bacteroidia bacterium]
MKKTIVKITLLLFLSVIAFNYCFAQEANQKIKWMSFEEAVKKNEKDQKKIFIDVYTHWCGWCKRMDSGTFMVDSIANYMNEKFYAVKLDAETKDSIHFKDKVFGFRPDFKSNEFAVSLLNGQMSYPTFVFLDENVNMLSPLPGYQTSEQLFPVMKFYGENIYKTKTWDQFTTGSIEGAK